MPANPPKTHLSPDVWAVFLALILALVVRLGIVQSVPW
jgi:hypothetical protein